MLVGVPKEIKNHEYRVGLTPASVRELIAHQHQVIVETGAGEGIGITDEEFQAVGAEIVDVATVFEKADFIIKVKEPQEEECQRLREGQLLFAYLHLAADCKQLQLLKESGCIAIAYETVTDDAGRLPLLSPMSEVAGRMSIQAGAHCLEKEKRGRGVLLGGVPGVSPADVVVIGGGVVGTNAVRMAMGMEASVTVLDKSLDRLKTLDLQFGSKLNTIFSTSNSIEHYVLRADLVVGAVLIPGAATPRLVTEDMIQSMRSGSVLVDVAIDQGGSFVTSRPTTHSDPTYVTHDVIHYCVTNMPGAVPRTATFALNNATLPFILQLVDKGYRQAIFDDPHLANGLNVYRGRVTHQAVAESCQEDYIAVRQAFESTF